MEVIPADALTPVGTYTGKCQLIFEKTSITIKGASSSEIGVWPYDVIRRFYCHDLIYFRFTSGRRGPYGVQDYKFRVNEHDLVALQKVLAQYTGAHFEPPPRSSRSHSESQVQASGALPSSGSHTPTNRLTHSPSVSHVLPPPTQPGYQTMTITGETKTIPPSTGPPSSSSSISRPPSVSSRLSSTGSPKNSPKLSTNKKFTSSLGTDDPFFGPQRTHSSSSVSSLDFGPTPSPTTPTFKASKTSPRTSRLSSHMYEDAEKIPPKSSGSSGGYDRLRKEESNPSSSTLTFSYDSVEKRIKSPSPKDKSPPLSPALTEKEIKHIKKYNKEPLINKSETVHHRRNAEYNYIDIPHSETSSECGSIDSRPNSSLIYDTPSSRPVSNAELLDSDRSSLYDVPPPSRPLLSDTYDIPRSSLSLPPSSTPITSRALPHLPNDYVNMRPQGNSFVMEDLYSVIPEPRSTNATVLQSEMVDGGGKETGELPGQKLAQEMAEEEGYILVNPATLPALVSPPPASRQSLSRSDSKTPPLEMDNEYIEVRRQPVVKTTLVSSGLDVPMSPLPSNDPAPPPVHHYINVPSRSPSQRKGTNPYEEITEVRPLLLMRSEATGIETLIITPVKEERSSTQDTNDTFTDSMISTDAVFDNSNVVAGGDDALPKVTSSETRISTTTLSEPVESGPPPIIARVSRSVVSDTSNNDLRNTTQYHNVSITGTINSKLSSPPASTDDASKDENKVCHLKTDAPPPLNFSLGDPEDSLSNPLEEDNGMEHSGGGHVETVTPEEEIQGLLKQDSVTSSLSDSLTPETSLSSNNLLLVGETHRSVSAPIPLSKSLIPVAQGSPDALHVSHRKRSLTSGDPLESPQYKEPSKKHTYVNVPAEFVPISPSPSSSHSPSTIKKPMPLPRPANISIITTGIGSCCYGEGKDTPSCLPLAVNSNCSNNNIYSSKVRALIRQFSS
ncbi:PREDICTED: microtubule-associated protein 1A-like [Amphimedon queenslandica]|uniref:Uncharacterized protein n=1 Tax=Amphimedon queenslandica TaxID=400682 RepID=A0A1X7V514_AMPQE|nr:PREDICTED: microtubule-associated protein 1A-like [Amphimedon queenslandica]|eukprot:XP_019850652.1 PREDICTED: microtubule-associated protein 1A-like [Amphimedon queenslandica]